jgi:hypothetical protein
LINKEFIGILFRFNNFDFNSYKTPGNNINVKELLQDLVRFGWRFEKLQEYLSLRFFEPGLYYASRTFTYSGLLMKETPS